MTSGESYSAAAAAERRGSLFSRLPAVTLLLYVGAYFLTPYKPWGLPISLHTLVLALGLCVCAARLWRADRRAGAHPPADVYLLAVAALFFFISAGIVHHKEFSVPVTIAYLMSFLSLLFVRTAITKSALSGLFYFLQAYLILSGIFIVAQTHSPGFYSLPILLGQEKMIEGFSGGGFSSSSILAGGSISWMLGILLTRYSVASGRTSGLWQEILYFSAVCLGALGLFYTLNRGAWLGLAAGIAVLGAALSVSRLSLGRLIKSLVVVLCFVLLAGFILRPKMVRLPAQLSFITNVVKGGESGVSGVLVNDPSTLTRLKSWKLALDGIAASPVWGIGPGQYPVLYERAFPALYAGVAAGKFDPLKTQTASNSYLYYAVEAGLLPAAALLVFIGVIFYKGFKCGTASPVFPFLIGGVVMCVWLIACDYISDRIFWIALGTISGLAFSGADAEGMPEAPDGRLRK